MKELASWQQRLAEHFREISSRRNGAGGKAPVFALEHGLEAVEIQAMTAAVRAQISQGVPLADHALPWIVYAAEIGYGYAGDEYWQTFEEHTPGWTAHGSRDWIRDRYQAFQRAYGGAQPSGAWAEHFSIICWPITHAILPRDLQRQLARVLYDIRHSFSADVFESPQDLGELIKSRSWSTTSRFQSFVEQAYLVGQIAMALLLQGQRDTGNLIHAATLRRIGGDLERERQVREWLHRARGSAQDRAKLRGLGTGRQTSTTFQNPEEARAEVVRLGIEPRLLLRPIEGSRWEVSLEIPDLSHLLLRFPQVRDILSESRCTVTGAASRPLARGRFLHGPQRITISHWPRVDDVLLRFERTDAQLEYLLRTECMLRPGTVWLFRIASDGIAYESRGRRVRAGSKYLIVSTEPFAQSSLAHPVELTCQGVSAVLLEVPPALTSDSEQALRQFHVTRTKSIEVWPAGLAALAWDGEGHGEWLASETPILAIRSDHAIDELAIAIEDGPSLSLSLTDAPPGEPVFVELPPLPVGLHKLTFATRDPEVVGDLEVVMRVREARQRSPDATAHGLLEMEVDPAAPSLEQLWEDQAAVLIRGPVGRQVKCRVEMYAQIDGPPTFEKQLPPELFPLSSANWTRCFTKHIKEDKRAQSAYDEARLCKIAFSADELGLVTLSCEREYIPLRWSVRQSSDGFIACLHNDVGSGNLVIERFSFERPAVGEKVPSGLELRAPRNGGLYVATLDNFRAAIIVPPIVKELADLRCESIIDVRHRAPETIKRLMLLSHLWGRARLSGDLIATARRREVLRALTAHIFTVLGGSAWANAESRLKDGNAGLGDLARSISHKHTTLGRKLLATSREFAGAPLPKRVIGLAQLAEESRIMPIKYEGKVIGGSTSKRRLRASQGTGPEYSVWLAECALRVASDAATADDWGGEYLNPALVKLLEVPTMARAARFLVLAIEQHVESLEPDFLPAWGEVYAGWRWSV
ncbi:MAG TPA: hypothetical protein VFN22_13030 [Gemmatimonadales bacterium]|nr:hypothetical protein [Gemmatimonadales bacterium]